MAYKFGNESHLLPNLYARAQRFRAIRGVVIQETSIQQMTVITFKNLFQMKGHSTTMKIAGCLF